MRRWWFRNLPAKATILVLALAAALVFYGLIQASPGASTASAQDPPPTPTTSPPTTATTGPRSTATPPETSSGEQIAPAPTPAPTQAPRARRSRGS
ncbi:MAG: hypothetical protein IT304_04795 [Dehalococcoidia bacterium]|nr:hypothetical protein [Dehalococcoidia bacterium]